MSIERKNRITTTETARALVLLCKGLSLEEIAVKMNIEESVIDRATVAFDDYRRERDNELKTEQNKVETLERFISEKRLHINNDMRVKVEFEDATAIDTVGKWQRLESAGFVPAQTGAITVGRDNGKYGKTENP